MLNNKREFLIRSFLAIPESREEAVWLLERIREEKAKASTHLDQLEHLGAMAYSEALDNFEQAVEREVDYERQHENIDRNEDPDLYYQYCFDQDRRANDAYDEEEIALASYYPEAEPTYYGTFHTAQDGFRRWLAIEEELYESVGFEFCFNESEAYIIGLRIAAREHKPTESVFLRMIVDNTLSLLTDGNAILYAMLNKVQLAENEYIEQLQYDPDERSEHTIVNLEEAQTELDEFLAKMAVCWDAFQELIESPKIAEYIPEELRNEASEGDRTAFVLKALEVQAIKNGKYVAKEEDSNEEQGDAGNPSLSDPDVPF